MIKKNLFILFVFYFFVLQLLVAGLLWGEPRFYLLGGINLLAMLLVSASYRFFTKASAPSREVPLPNNEKADLTEETSLEEKAEPAPLSESNIEYIKTKINRTSKKPLAPASGLYRLLMFLLACVGFGGVLYLFWDTFDFIAVIIGGILMVLFLGVVFKLANLWRKNILCSGYVLFFLALGAFGIFGLGWSAQFPWLEMTKTEITTFIDGIKGLEEDAPLPVQPDLELSGFLFEQTGTVIEGSLTGALLSGEFLTGDQENLALTTGTQETLELESPELSTGEKADPKSEVSMLDAIKHLIQANAIPLSTSKTVRFTYVAQSNEDYPYMKTALEKKMIGSTTNPETLISCDVYMVMKGLAEGRTISKTADVKADYWRVAAAKDLLNGCQKGARLTVANL